MCSFLGGVVAQEIVKYTGKYTPLRQFLYLDMFELIDSVELPTDAASYTLENSRYDDQIAIFGKQNVEKIKNLNLFVVGAGALGCEFMKQLAMMGACSGGTGKLTITDMDRIEVGGVLTWVLVDFFVGGRRDKDKIFPDGCI